MGLAKTSTTRAFSFATAPSCDVLSRLPGPAQLHPTGAEHHELMTTPLLIIINAGADVALLGLLAFVMSRAVKLTPHHPERPREPLSRVSRRSRSRAVVVAPLISAGTPGR